MSSEFSIVCCEPHKGFRIVSKAEVDIFSEKAMAPHSSTLAWKIPWTEESVRLQSMGSRSRTRLSDFTFTFHFHALEKEMAAHSSVLAWRIPGTGDPGELPSMGSRSRTRLKPLSSSSSSQAFLHQLLVLWPVTVLKLRTTCIIIT